MVSLDPWKPVRSESYKVTRRGDIPWSSGRAVSEFPSISPPSLIPYHSSLSTLLSAPRAAPAGGSILINVGSPAQQTVLWSVAPRSSTRYTLGGLDGAVLAYNVAANRGVLVVSNSSDVIVEHRMPGINCTYLPILHLFFLLVIFPLRRAFLPYRLLLEWLLFPSFPSALARYLLTHTVWA
jgi:hypothetical protein